MTRSAARAPRWLLALVLALGCDRASPPATSEPDAGAGPVSGAIAGAEDEPSPPFRNVGTATSYVGDDACTTCHEEAAAAYRARAMARSFHAWTPETRIEATLDEPVEHVPTGFSYSVVEEDGALYQVESLTGRDGRRLHELRRRMDWVMGSGVVARTYFTEENGRLFQLPLTWYAEGGWDFSPGYELDNARFDRLMPDRCLACHGSYPEPIPFLEGKYEKLSPGIGCERCHGPGALHVSEREAGIPADSGYDDTIVNPTHLPVQRRLDVCDQCHVHTPVTVLRAGRNAFSYVPSEPLHEHAAFFKAAGSIDIVSHADRMRQSACFLATRSGAQPLECATCHDPHAPAGSALRNEPCQACHTPAALAARLTASSSLADHGDGADCVDCHMPRVKERTVPHGSFTDHWIRVVDRSADPPGAGGSRDSPLQGESGDSPVEPYYARDRTGPDGPIYRGMGEIVYATLATDAQLMARGAERLERALRSDTMRGDAHFLLGLAYRQLGRVEDAIPALERSLARSLRLDVDRPQRLHALARAYQSVGRDPASIDSLYRRALELQPALAWIRADYARFLLAEDRREEAEEAYRAALRERPSLAVAAFELGTLLAGQGRRGEAAEAFESAVRIDPALAEGLSPLLQIRTAAGSVTGARVLGSPLGLTPLRDRGPGAVRLVIDAAAAQPAVRFVNVPPGGTVRIAQPDGTLVRGLSAGDGSGISWDLRDERGRPVAGGLYHVDARAPDPSGGPSTPQRFRFGVVRVGGR